MQGNTFKAILEETEMHGNSYPESNAAHNVDQFQDMIDSLFGSPDPRGAGKTNMWSAAIGAYADSDYVKDIKPAKSQRKRRPPFSLAQLKKNLGEGLTIGELSKLRRKFAFENHPDRLPTTERCSATSRLATANDLIDLAIQNLDQKPSSR